MADRNAVTPRLVEISPAIRVGRGQKLLLIAGPCQIESLEHCLLIASHLIALAKKYDVNLVFKSSYDKANRTSITGQRGLGIDQGLAILKQVKETTGLPLLTDVHSPEQAIKAAAVVDILQTPAFLCRQTDLLMAAGSTGKVVNVKKGQFLHPSDMQHVAAKVAHAGNHKVLLCERGTCFGYRDLVVDMRSLLIMAESGYPIVFDATHSVQQMGGDAGASGGLREYIAPLVRGAVAVGIDALFIECHDNPSKAPSDGASMLRLEDMEDLLRSATRLRAAAS